MATTFLKRQKEMKRMEKQREKAERRAQRKLTGGNGNEISYEKIDGFEDEPSTTDPAASAETESPQN